MPFVSAQYDAIPEFDPPGMAKPVLAVDQQGVVWSLREDSEVGDWLEYIGNGGTIDPFIPPPIASYQVNMERDRRITGGFELDGHRYQTDEFSQRNIMDAANAADVAINQNGAKHGDLRWQLDATADFGWLTTTNERVPMDAYETQRLGQMLVRFKQRCIMNARALKDTDPIPEDYTDDRHWPFDWQPPPTSMPIPIINISNANPAAVKVSSTNFPLFSVGQLVRFIDTGSSILDDPNNEYTITSTNDVGKSFKIDCDLSAAPASYTTGSVIVLLTPEIPQ